MTAAEDPHWADQLSAWSTFATALLALAAAIGAIGTLIVAWKTFKSQNAVFAEQIKQLQEDRERREQQDREKEDERREKQLNEARQIIVRTGSLEDGHLVPLMHLIDQAEKGSGVPIFPAAVVLVANNSLSPISAIESEFADSVPRHCWVEGSGRLAYGLKLDHLASGASAYFVHTGIHEENIPHMRTAVTFTDESGQRWQTDAEGRTRKVRGE